MNVGVGHAGEEIPVLIVFAGVGGAEIIIIAQPIRALGGFAATLTGAARPVALQFFRGLVFFRRIDPDIQTFPASKFVIRSHDTYMMFVIVNPAPKFKDWPKWV